MTMLWTGGTAPGAGTETVPRGGPRRGGPGAKAARAAGRRAWLEAHAHEGDAQREIRGLIRDGVIRVAPRRGGGIRILPATPGESAPAV